MMSANPIEVLFGPRVVLLLRHQPSALRRIAERVKPLLMGALHPDRNPDASPLAAEVSEAYQSLVRLSLEEIAPFIEEFLSKNRADAIRRELRNEKQQRQSLERAVRQRDDEIKRLTDLLLHAGKTRSASLYTAWLWLASGALLETKALRTLPRGIFPSGAVPRGMLHHYRIIVSRGDRSFVSYEFDIVGRVRLTVFSHTIEDAREAALFRGRHSRPGVRIMRRRGQVLIGGAHDFPEGIRVADAMNQGIIKPYIGRGMIPIFCLATSYNTSRLDHAILQFTGEERVIDLVPLKKSRTKLLGAMGKGRKKSLKARLLTYKTNRRAKN